MQVLVVANGGGRCEALSRLVREAGHELCGTSDPDGVSLAVLRKRPQLLLVEALGDGYTALRRLLERARATAQQPLPSLLLLPPLSPWLRAPLPPRMMPAGVLASDVVDSDTLGRALSALASVAAATPVASPPEGELRLDRLQRLASGPAGSTLLTVSEAKLLAAVLDGGGAVITSGRVAELLWGDRGLDRRRRAAIRSHVHTLRRSLREIGSGGAIVTLPGVGYRLELPARGE